MSDDNNQSSFERVKDRLDWIVQAVNDADLPLDKALDLYEEAVSLGMQASDLLEQGIHIPDEHDEQGEQESKEDQVAHDEVVAVAHEVAAAEQNETVATDQSDQDKQAAQPVQASESDQADASDRVAY